MTPSSVAGAVQKADDRRAMGVEDELKARWEQLSAAQKGAVYYNALKKFESNIEKQVFENIFERHIKRLGF